MVAARDTLARLWCGKRTYPDRPSALRAARSINDGLSGEATAYYCETCESFHFGRKGTRANIPTDKSLHEDTTVLQTIERGKPVAPIKVDAAIKETISVDSELSWLAQRVAKGRDAPFCEIAAITPAIAKHLLERNDDNRPLSQAQVDHICHDIKAGHWVLNGETVIVAKDGCLNDGQNRLAAIVQADLPVQSVVVFGVSRKSRLTVDMGRQRSAANFLSMSGVKNSTNIAAALSLFMAYGKGSYGVNYMGATAPTKQDIRAEYDKRSKSVDAAVSLAISDRFGSIAGVAPLSVAHMILIPLNFTEASVFFAKLLDGVNLKRGDPILYLRAHLTETKKDRLRAWQKLEIILRYWNAWREGKVLSKKIAMSGSYPKLVR